MNRPFCPGEKNDVWFWHKIDPAGPGDKHDRRMQKGLADAPNGLSFHRTLCGLHCDTNSAGATTDAYPRCGTCFAA
jgi:hypothetical protein